MAALGHSTAILGGNMTVLMTARIPGGTKEMIDQLQPLLEPIRTTKGFQVHTNGQVADGWLVTEVWDSQADFEEWFEGNVKPNFAADGPTPEITFIELNDFVTA
jgi:heme-degrading monooxygenase HmoA